MSPTSETPPRIPSAAALRASLDRDGYVVVPALLPPAHVPPLRAAAAAAADLARAGRWPHVRTLPKQFPPWDAADAREKGIWGVQHLLHPDMPGWRVFAQSYFAKEVREVVGGITGVAWGEEGEEEEGKEGKDGEDGEGGGELVMELYNLLVRPEHDFELRWHRDDISPDATTAEEEQRLCGDAEHGRTYAHAQWNLALYPDASLIVVPGSHRRARTQAEREADPYAQGLEGELAVQLQPGDAVFYDNNILHRGVYRAATERMTLHGSVGAAGRADERARNVLQHGVGAWVGRASFAGLRGGTGRAAEGMRRRLVRMGEGREVEYSQKD